MPRAEHRAVDTTALLASLLRDHEFRLAPPVRLGPDRPLPRTLDHTALRCEIIPRSG